MTDCLQRAQVQHSTSYFIRWALTVGSQTARQSKIHSPGLGPRSKVTVPRGDGARVGSYQRDTLYSYGLKVSSR